MMDEKMREQQETLCKKYNSPCFFCSGDEVIGVAINSLMKQPIYGVRHTRENGSCGWYLWGGDYLDDESFFQPIHFLHIDDIVPSFILKYLALAPGFKFISDENDYEDVWYEG
ncbi:immunity protein Imm33 domain-containing protein [Yersinia pseudotuberculosis]|uniref:Imm33-like domain-containing protein n=2 Tax=Yersinia TaxID=629 RepID=A0A0U1R3E1_YERP3|nr:hypothetical protein [Yersinia pseudotuberculosis]ABS49854.1 conserved hypothetical protein [Yersinia pseudotuberculosis IP 31758]MCE4114583.1 hypothetical protein [Yersinia pseudotuberculosis]RYC20210.1 hypothetical protein EU971_19440 [Yersinia pseudotuberculosis]WLF04570.1 hypothetical protein Q6G25_03525 [Yersinia pseudotuberculosis]